MTPPAGEPGTNGVSWRVGDLERRVIHLEERDQSVGELTVGMRYLQRELDEVKGMVRWMQRTMIGLAGTILAGALIFAITHHGGA